jgi:hypothetical protein
MTFFHSCHVFKVTKDNYKWMWQWRCLLKECRPCSYYYALISKAVGVACWLRLGWYKAEWKQSA